MFGTAAWQLALPLSVGTAGQFTVGGVLSATVKLVVQLALLPAASVAVTMIVWAPNPIIVPATGDWLRVIAPQPPLTVTPLKMSGAATSQLPSALAPGTAGQFTVSGAKPMLLLSASYAPMSIVPPTIRAKPR